MVLAYAIILLIILALLFRRDLSTIAQLPYRGNWKLLAIVLGLFTLQWTTILFNPDRTVFHMILLTLSHIALALLFLLNRHLPGAKLFALGIILNTLVMVVNGGWMPLTPEAYSYVHPNQSAIEIQAKPVKSKNVILPRTETALWILSDIIPVALPWRRNVLSIGDVLMVLGVAQFLFQATSKKTKQITDTSVGSPLKTI